MDTRAARRLLVEYLRSRSWRTDDDDAAMHLQKLASAIERLPDHHRELEALAAVQPDDEAFIPCTESLGHIAAITGTVDPTDFLRALVAAEASADADLLLLSIEGQA